MARRARASVGDASVARRERLASCQDMLAKKRIQGEVLDHVPDRLENNSMTLMQLKVADGGGDGGDGGGGGGGARGQRKTPAGRPSGARRVHARRPLLKRLQCARIIFDEFLYTPSK